MESVQVSMTKNAIDYLRRLHDLGAVEESNGQVVISAEIRPIIDALHHVLAGGKATVSVEQEGTPLLVNEIETMLQQTLSDGNAMLVPCDLEAETNVVPFAS